MIVEVLVAALVVMLVSLAGVVFVNRSAQNFLEKNLAYLISFSAGVFLMTAGGLGLEVFELAPTWWLGALLIAVGYFLATSMHLLLPETHHHDVACDGDHSHAHGKVAQKLILGDAIHNVADGIVIVVAFAASPTLGIAATLSIVIHELLQEISEFFVLRRAGYSVRKALIVNFGVSSTILVGVGLGYLALASSTLELMLLALSAGFFLQIVANDLLPKRKDHSGETFLKHMIFVLVGVLLMSLIALFLSEGHVHSDEDGYGHGIENHDDHDEHQGDTI